MTQTAKEKRAEYQREWRKNNPEKIKKYDRAWRAKHPEKQKEYDARTNRSRARKDWLANNRDKVRKWARNSNRRRHQQARRAIIEALGGKCMMCGFNDFRVMVCHHRNGGGRKERLNSNNNQVFGYRYYVKMLSHLEDIDLLCANCHSILEWDKSQERGAK